MKIDLGEPVGMLTAEMPVNPKMPEKYYPTITVRSKESHDFPQEGTMLVTFKKKSEETRTDEEGNSSYSCTLEIQSIDKIKGERGDGDMPKNRGREAEDALESIRKSKGSY